MANKDLFKQAIAEAKSVREAAIANAKEALEETLTPHLKDMLAAKLQEQEDKDDAMEEMKHDDEMDEVVDIAEEEAEDDSMELDDEAEEEAEMDDMEAEEEVDGDEDLGDLSVDEFKDMIRDIIAQELGRAEAEMDDMDAGDIEGMGDEEEIDLDELLAELKDVSNEGMKKYHDMTKLNEAPEGMYYIQVSVLDARKALAIIDDQPALRKAVEMNGSTVYYLTDEELAYDLMMDFAAQDIEVVDTNIGLETMGSAASDSIGNTVREKEDHKEMEEELNEATKTIESLQKDLQEVNLLNSKLLYVNKIFKANNLSESQKVNVISAFDKAETVKEAKLVFETVSENVVASKKVNVAESKIKGMASKATGTTASKPEVINEASEAVRRMQVLAGIIK